MYTATEAGTRRTVTVGEIITSSQTGRRATLVGLSQEGTHSYVHVVREGETVTRRAYAHVYGIRVTEAPSGVARVALRESHGPIPVGARGTVEGVTGSLAAVRFDGIAGVWGISPVYLSQIVESAQAPLEYRSEGYRIAIVYNPGNVTLTPEALAHIVHLADTGWMDGTTDTRGGYVSWEVS